MGGRVRGDWVQKFDWNHRERPDDKTNAERVRFLAKQWKPRAGENHSATAIGALMILAEVVVELIDIEEQRARDAEAETIERFEDAALPTATRQAKKKRGR